MSGRDGVRVWVVLLLNKREGGEVGYVGRKTVG